MCFRASTLRSDAHTVTPVVIGRRCVRLRFTMAKIVTAIWLGGYCVKARPDTEGLNGTRLSSAHETYWPNLQY